MLDAIREMTSTEWAVVAVAMAICLLGSLLPRIGNLLGRLFLGEDPLLARWRQQRVERRTLALSQRQDRRDAKKAKKTAARNKPTAFDPSHS